VGGAPSWPYQAHLALDLPLSGDVLAAIAQALALHRELGNQMGEAETLDSLGHAHQHLSHHRQAIECYRQALDLRRTIGHRYKEAATLTHLGDTHHAADDQDAARDTWEQALAIFEELQHPDAEQVRLKLKALT
jgi:tetratricopeptide (TPR) repeat protein